MLAVAFQPTPEANESQESFATRVTGERVLTLHASYSPDNE